MAGDSTELGSNLGVFFAHAKIKFYDNSGYRILVKMKFQFWSMGWSSVPLFSSKLLQARLYVRAHACVGLLVLSSCQLAKPW